MSEALIVRDEPDTLMPMSMGTTFAAYKAMQTEIDKAMPDQIIKIGPRQFRCKGYWRAVRAAFGLKVWCVSEERIEPEPGHWGYSVLYRAEGKNGMSADGDGVCMASEKRGGQGSVHNVRSHAHTRAFNRAVSNLVGFGEVSAEEIQHDEPVVEAQVVAPKPHYAAKAAPPVVSPGDDGMFDDPEMGSYDPQMSTTPPACYVSKLDKRTGEKNGKAWTQFFITLSDGRTGSFFDGQLGVSAQAALAAKTPVIATFEQSGKYTNLVSLLRAS